MKSTLAEFEQAIDEQISNHDVWDARYQLRLLSAEIRRMLWRDHNRAKMLAKKADNAANMIENTNDDMVVTRPMPRFDGLYSGGIWHPPIQ